MRLSVIRAGGENPFENLATEQCLMDAVGEDEVILYLWQNRHTVVIGKNQNAWAECDVRRLEREGGTLARRPSGGGAVYHDLGNLNFSFVAHRRHYDVARQLSVLIRALAAFGIRAEASGRNDVTIDGRKCSGNAFSARGDRRCHHGTVLIDVDREKMARYLTVPKEKLESKGVSSVRARVCNLTEHDPSITAERMVGALEKAFGTVYGGTPKPFDLGRIDRDAHEALVARFAGWDWRFGREIPFSVERSRRFPWGMATVRLDVRGGFIRDAAVYTDAMETEWAAEAAERLIGTRYPPDEICGKMEQSEQTTALLQWLGEASR